MKKICVVHLVRFCNNIDLFISFIKSYKCFSAGVEHNLLIVFKGFTSDQKDLATYRNLLEHIDYNEYFVSDEGVDITAYIKVMNAFRYDAYCFLNSHSKILAQDWLSKLYAALEQENVGLVGATGSYQSMYTDQIGPGIRFLTRVKSKSFFKNIFHFIFWLLSNFCKPIVFFWRWIFFSINFDKFPNPHIRSNAFIVPSEVTMKICHLTIKTKMDAWLFESGKNGLTSIVKNMGKKVLIVGKNGKSYEEYQWENCGIYKQANQANLLIADNQTNVYQHGDIDLRKLHAKYAWGNEKAALIESDICMDHS